MSTLLTVARIAAAVNVVLLVALAYVWGSNYRRIRSKQTLGTLVFAVLLLAENVLAFYYYTFSGLELTTPAARAMMLLQALELLAIAFLTWVTYD
ncbi:hypothetical protein [Natronomonas marina]|jgi:hypothetical protein|uniref:hypothetical protein n=1 Tax=Natronomonas marina TaxID=2961939 RepID=UPI0020CA1A77|nr:hypothetical protein [Natronomonas marina]